MGVIIVWNYRVVIEIVGMMRSTDIIIMTGLGIELVVMLCGICLCVLESGESTLILTLYNKGPLLHSFEIEDFSFFSLKFLISINVF